ncbi:hypothetical protein [Pseudoduganella sp. OTU4001]|uniref:hypothetical protein n=1 Tax=Pseudoduganella sp. OTU4001 TaxID=3043854 RepID=UPI00313C5FFD
MIKTRLIAAAAAVLLAHSACAASWEVIAGAPVALDPAPLVAPRGIAVGRDGAIYFTDGAAVRVLKGDGKVATLPGRFIAPAGLAVASDGTVFVADAGNHVVKAISPAGDVRTMAGHAGAAGRADGKGIVAGFDRPAGLVLEASGSLLLADSGNNAVRRIASDGMVSTVAQRLPLQPQGIAVDARGGIVVHDAATALRIGAGGAWQELLPAAEPATPRPDGAPARIASGPQPARGGAGGEGRGSAAASTQAAEEACQRGKCLRRYQAPSMPLAPRGAQPAPAGQVALDGEGRLLATAPATGSIYRIERNGIITPLLGAGDVTGELSGVARGSDGSLHLLLAERLAAASWDASGKPQPLVLQYAASLNRDGPALQARFSDISQLAVGRDGGLYVLDGDQLRRIDKEGVVRTLLQEGGFRKLREQHPAAQVDLHGSMAARPSTGIFVTANGALAGVSTEGMISFISGPPGMSPDQTGMLPALRRIWAYVAQDAEPFVLPGLGRHRIAADASGQAWYCADNVLWRIRPRGVARKIALQGTDGCGDVLVAPNDEVFMLHGHYITRVGADGYQWLAAGSRERKNSTDGAGLLARFRRITQAVVDAQNNIHLLDDGILRRMSANGEITTEGKDLFAAVGKLRALAVGRKGVLYLATERTILRMKP